MYPQPPLRPRNHASVLFTKKAEKVSLSHDSRFRNDMAIPFRTGIHVADLKLKYELFDNGTSRGKGF